MTCFSKRTLQSSLVGAVDLDHDRVVIMRGETRLRLVQAIKLQNNEPVEDILNAYEGEKSTEITPESIEKLVRKQRPF